MGADEISVDDEPSWMVFVDRRGGRIVLIGHYGSEGYASAHLDHEASDGSIRVWRNESNDLVAAEAAIAHGTDDEIHQLHEFRSAVERLRLVADADSSWFEPADLIRMVPFDDDGAMSFITYGSGRPQDSNRTRRSGRRRLHGRFEPGQGERSAKAGVNRHAIASTSCVE